MIRNLTLMATLAGSLLLGSTALAGFKLSPATVLTGGTTSTVTFHIGIENTTGSPVTVTGIGPMTFGTTITALPGASGFTPIFASTPNLVSGFNLPESAVAPFAFSPLALPGLNLFESVAGVVVPAGSTVDFAAIDIDIAGNFMGDFALTLASDVVVTDFVTFGGVGGILPLGASAGDTLTASVSAVPEPSSFLFMGLVGIGLIGVRKYRNSMAIESVDEVAA